jgi:hypothetical protein
MGVELGLSLLRKGHKLSLCENRVLRRIFGPKREEVVEPEEEELVFCALHEILLR